MNLPALSHIYTGRIKGTLNLSDFKGKKKRAYTHPYIHTHIYIFISILYTTPTASSTLCSPLSLPQHRPLPSFISTPEILIQGPVQSLQSLKSLDKCNGEGEMQKESHPKIHLPSDASPTASCFSWMAPHANSHEQSLI